MIAVEACGISSNALLMALPSQQHVQAPFVHDASLTADISAAIFYIKIALMERNIKNTNYE